MINNPPAIQFPYKSEFIYVKIGEPLTKTPNLSTVSSRISSLRCFPWNSIESKDSLSFNILGVTMKSQKYGKSEALIDVGLVSRHSKDRTTRSKTDWQNTIQFAQINVY